jgi:hypothetical protein
MSWKSIQYVPSQYVQAGGWADRHDKANKHFLQTCNTLTVWESQLSYRDIFINNPTDGIQHSRLFSKMAYRAAIAAIPFAVIAKSVCLSLTFNRTSTLLNI